CSSSADTSNGESTTTSSSSNSALPASCASTVPVAISAETAAKVTLGSVGYFLVCMLVGGHQATAVQPPPGNRKTKSRRAREPLARDKTERMWPVVSARDTPTSD